MNLYKLWSKSGRCYYIRAKYSFEAENAVNRLEKSDSAVSSWDVINGAPADATILDSWNV